MKFSILLTASAFVATTFAGPNLITHGTPVGAAECRFVAAVYSALPTGGYRRCQMETALPADNCPKIASMFKTSTGSCSSLISARECPDSKPGVQDKSCSGFYSRVIPELTRDDIMLTALKNCLKELKPVKDLKMWTPGCATVKNPK